MAVNFGDFVNLGQVQGGDFVVGYRGISETRCTVSVLTAGNNAYLLKTGGLVTNSITTTKSLTSDFTINDEFITKRYADALAFATTISGNFVPALYYTKTETNDLLINPDSVYITTQANSAFWGSGGLGNTVYSSNSGRYESNYSSTIANSGRYESNYTSTQQNSAFWGSGGVGSTVYSANSGRYESTYATVCANSATYTTYNYVYGNYLPLTGGVLTGALTATSFSLANTVLPYQKFNVSGGQTSFTLASAVGSINDILVFVSGVYQRKDTYSLTDPYTLLLDSAPPAGTDILEVSYLKAFPVATYIPGDNTVITSAIADGSVTNSKIANGSVTFAKLSSLYAAIPVQTISANGLTTTFNLLSAVANPNEIMVYIDGVYQNKSAYDIPTNTTILFSEAPASSAVIEISYLRSVPYQTFIFEDRSVNSAKLATTLILQSVSAQSLSASSLRISTDAMPTGFTGLSAVTVFGAVSARTMTTTDYAILVRINNQNFGIPLFTIS